MTQIINRYNNNIIVEGEMGLRELILHYVGIERKAGRSTDLSEADLRGADLRGADLIEANLSRADLRGANLDYSAWPLQCTSLKAKVDNRIAAQLLFHSFAVAEMIPTSEQMQFIATNFHRFAECGGKETLLDKGGDQWHQTQ